MPARADLAPGAGHLSAVECEVEAVAVEALVLAVLAGGIARQRPGDGDLVFAGGASAPVVSLTVGDACVLRFGNTETRNRPYTDVELASGAPATGLRGGRLNVTMRVTGLTGG